MNRSASLVCIAALLGSASAAPAGYTASDGTATFDYKVRFINVRGNIDAVTAKVSLDPGSLAATKGTVTVPLDNLKTGIGLRDSHAKGEEALNTAKFPNATFELAGLTGGRLAEGASVATTASGKLTVKGVTKTVTVPVKATMQGGKVNVSTQFKFNPIEYGVTYPGGADTITINVAFTLANG